MATDASGAAFTNSPRSRRPFMVLDLQNVPQNCTKVTFHQQCYKLVPDLTPDDASPEQHSTAQLTRSQLQTRTNQNPDQSNDQPKSTHTNEPLRRRRQLPEIPAGKKPLEKLWQKSIYTESTDPLSVEIANSLNSAQPTTSTPVRQSNLRLTRKLSSKMLLEIETDPDSGKALSLRLINEDDDAEKDLTSGQEKGSPEVDDDCFDSFAPAASSSAIYNSKPTQDRSTSFGASASDSGVSSMQSPSVSTNSDQPDSIGSKAEQCQVRPLKVPEATHRALYRFCARHEDEINLDIGDGVHVFQEHEDLWSDGVNIRTGERGIFPSSLVTDIEYSEFTIESSNLQMGSKLNLFDQEQHMPPLNFRIKRERYLLDFLGSIEVGEPKGEEVLKEAISRVSASGLAKPSDIDMNTPCQCILEISDVGLRMMDDSSRTAVNTKKINRVDYFFSLMQITFCGYKLDHSVYFFAFITRHPTDKGRYACHVFRAPENTREVAESVGRAFHRFYNHFVEVSLPLETFYLDD